MSHPTANLIAIDYHRVAARRVWLCCALLFACLLLSHSAFAQNDRPAVFSEITKQVLTDPTTYVPSATLYNSMQLDWNSSQPLFRNGFLENNARYTRSGLPHDLAMSYGAGNLKIAGDSLMIVPASLANNALNRVLQHSLNERFPQHRKMWATLAWIERATFASYSAYEVSSPHFEQWKKNERLAKQLGY